MSRHLRTTLVAAAAVLLIGAAVAGALVLQSNRSAPVSAQETELGPGSAAFAEHVDAFSKDGGDAPASWADQDYQLNGGDAITGADITGAQAAFSAIKKRGVGQGRSSTASWFSLG